MKRLSDHLKHLKTDQFQVDNGEEEMTTIGKNRPALIRSNSDAELLGTGSDLQRIVFQHSILCQTFFPYMNPGDIDVWERSQGNATLLIQPGYVRDRHTNEKRKTGVPYGSNARVLLTYINTQAIKMKNMSEPLIPLGRNMSQLLDALGKTSKGKRTRESVDEQLHRIAGCRIQLLFSGNIGNKQRVSGSNLTIIDDYDLWYSKDDSDSQEYLFPSFVRLNTRYFENLKNHAVPLDEETVLSLAQDAMALDIYTWLANRLHTIPHGKTVNIGWTSLKEQFGQSIGRMDNFKSKFRQKLKKVLSHYDAARIEEEPNKFLRLHHSQPPVLKNKLLTR